MDLITKMDISLGEALTGFRRIVTHLDGRKVVISSPAGKVVKHEDVKIISGEGMPKYVVRIIRLSPLTRVPWSSSTYRIGTKQAGRAPTLTLTLTTPSPPSPKVPLAL